MDNFYPWGFIIMFFSLLILSITGGEKTSHEDDDIDDYWSDGQCSIYNPQQNKTNDTDRVSFISIIFYFCNLCIVQLCDIIETTIFFKLITNKRNNKHVPRRRNESKSEPEKA